jgi:chemotaxis protein methyltransferase CheR
MDKLLAITSEFGLGSLDDCLNLLSTLPLEAPLVQRLLERFTNKESYFFRDATTMDTLRTEVLPALIRAAQDTRTLRVWSAGCSTGEEIYSLNILLCELIPNYDDWTIMLVGSDVDRTAVARARRGVYGAWSLRATSPEATASYFEPAAQSRHAIRARYRKNVSFTVHNLADPSAAIPAPSRFDLILCRNVTIYFSVGARLHVARTFAKALTPQGVWLAGPSDPLPSAGYETDVLPGVLRLRAAPQNKQESTPRTFGDPPTRRDLKRARDRALELVQNRPAPSSPRPVERAPETARRPEASARLELARRLADAGKMEEAGRALDAWLTPESACAEGYLLRAVLREAAHDLSGGLQDLTRVLYLEPSHVEARLRMGLTLARLGEHERAMSALREAISADAGKEELAELRAVAAQQLVRLIRKGSTP